MKKDSNFFFFYVSRRCNQASQVLRCLEVLNFSQLSPHHSTSLPPPIPQMLLVELLKNANITRRHLGVATSSGTRLSHPWGCSAWECNGKQVRLPPLCLREINIGHPPTCLTTSQAVADVIRSGQNKPFLNSGHSSSRCVRQLK